MRRFALALLVAVFASPLADAQITLRYAHMNTADSNPGLQASFFAKKVHEYSDGAVVVEVYPDSQLGTLQDQAEAVSSGLVAFHHTTAGSLGALYPDFGVLDTPYIYRNVDHLLKVVAPTSSVMSKLSAGLSKSKGVHVLYTFYFGTRELSCDRPIKEPSDLSTLMIRCLPFPIYQTAVEGLGAIATPIDWAATPTALAAKVVNGEENPVDIMLSSKLYEFQPYLMLTGHIMAAEIVVVNDDIWRRLSTDQRAAITRAAAEASAYATKLTLDTEAADLAALKDHGMKVIGPADGLDVTAFRNRTQALVKERLGALWSDYYSLIERTK
jgi:tripartite ATP-independent transporter DctP family solute receptor